MTEATKRGRGRPPKPETLRKRAVAAAAEERAALQQALPGMGPQVRQVRNRYDGAGNGRRLAGWNPPNSGPNTALLGIEKLRNRARDVSRNDWTGASSVQKWTTNLVGIGVRPRWKRIKSKKRKQEILDRWNDFVAQADADNVLNLFGLQTLGVRTWLDGGEAFIRRRARRLDEGLAVPLQIQLLESDMCPHLDADVYPGMPASSILRSGIELDRRRRTRIAYWFYKEHPEDKQTGYNGRELVRVLAADVAHMFEPTRPGALRGVSTLAPVLTRLRNIGDYDDAVLERQKLANLLVGFISRSLPPVTGLEPLDPLTNLPVEQDDLGPLAGLQPGTMQELEDGQTVSWSNPPEAGTTYSDYMRTSHLGTAAGTGLPYELLSGDIQNISDRALRVILNEFRRFAEQRQWQIIIPQMCERVIVWFSEAMLLAGHINVAEFDDVRRVEHAPHGWQHIHPVQDPQGKLLEVAGGLRSRSSVIGERGDDPDDVDQERADDMAREKELGLQVEPVDGADDDGSAGDDPAEEQERREQAEMRATNRAIADAMHHLVQHRVAAASTPAPAPPPVDNTLQLQQMALFERMTNLLAMEPVGGPQ